MTIDETMVAPNARAAEQVVAGMAEIIRERDKFKRMAAMRNPRAADSLEGLVLWNWPRWEGGGPVQPGDRINVSLGPDGFFVDSEPIDEVAFTDAAALIRVHGRPSPLRVPYGGGPVPRLVAEARLMACAGQGGDERPNVAKITEIRRNPPRKEM